MSTNHSLCTEHPSPRSASDIRKGVLCSGWLERNSNLFSLRTLSSPSSDIRSPLQHIQSASEWYASYWNAFLFFSYSSGMCVTAAGSFTVRPSVFPVIPAVSGILSLRTGSARPYLVVNRILIYSGGLGLPHQQGWGSCSSVLSTLLSGATVFMTSTKCEKLSVWFRPAGTVPSAPCSRRYY